LRVGRAAALVLAIGLATSSARAVESGFSTYGLGSQGFGSGVTPPPGFYVTPFFTYLDVESRNVTIGGAVTGKLTVDFVVMGFNLLYVPKVEVFGGRLGIGGTLPFGHNRTKGSFTLGPLSAQRTVSDWGLGDISLRAQLGRTVGEFNHTAYIMGVLPTGEYDTGFKPNIGLRRPGIDVGWGFTWDEKKLGLQLSATAGIMFNFNNTRTNYESGTEFHFERAIGKTFESGFIIGPVGYVYQQLSGDSGSGAVLGSLKPRDRAPASSAAIA
jgi:hypothetical protein